MSIKVIKVVDNEGYDFYTIKIKEEDLSTMFLEHFLWQTIYKVITYDKFKKTIKQHGGIYKKVAYEEYYMGKFAKIKYIYVFKMRIEAEVFVETVNSWLTIYNLMKED